MGKVETWETGEAPPEERREGGAKPPKTLIDGVEEGRERGDRARVEEEGGKRPMTKKRTKGQKEERKKGKGGKRAIT